MEQIQCDARGSARVFKAAFMLFTNPNMTVDDAMKAAEFTKREISKRSVRKSISKKKNRLLQAAARRNIASTLPPVQTITVSESIGANLSSISNSSEAMMLDDNPPNGEKSSTRKGEKNKGRSYKTSTSAFGRVHFSKDSRRTPSQVIKADKERKEGIA